MYLFCLLATCVAASSLQLGFSRVAVDGSSYKRSDLGLPLYNDLPHQRYLVNLTVGTPPQNLVVTLDTGSADLWVASPDSPGCAPHCPPNTFNANRSSSYRPTGQTFNATYGLTPGLQVVGPYFNETIHLGRAVIQNMTGKLCNLLWENMALGSVPKEIFASGIFGLMGLAPRLAETIYDNPSSPNYGNKSALFPTLYDQLKLRGYITRRIFSLWLNSQSAKTGSILFGGVDHSKYHGKLQTVPVVLSRQGDFRDWAVNLTSVSRLDSRGSLDKPLTPRIFPITTILDSGSPNMYLPTDLASDIASDMNSTTYQGFPYVPCSFRSSKKALEFGFGMKGPYIRVPYGEIIYPFGAPANIGEVRAKDGTKLCYLGLIGTQGPLYLLGDTLLRSTYLVYDVDAMQVSFAPTRFS